MSSRLLGSPSGGPASPGLSSPSGEGQTKRRASMITRHGMAAPGAAHANPALGAQSPDPAAAAKPAKAGKKPKVKKVALPGEELGYPLYHAITGNLPVLSKQFHVAPGAEGLAGPGGSGSGPSDYDYMTGNLPVISKELVMTAKELGDLSRRSAVGGGYFDDEEEMMPGWVELSDPVTRKTFWWNIYYKSYRETAPHPNDDGRRGSSRQGGERALYKAQLAHLRSLVLENLTLEELKGPGGSEIFADEPEPSETDVIPVPEGQAAFDPEAPAVTRGHARRIAKIYSHYVLNNGGGVGVDGKPTGATITSNPLAATQGAGGAGGGPAVSASKRRLINTISGGHEPALLPDGTANPRAALTKEQLTLSLLPPQFGPLFYLSPVVLARMRLASQAEGSAAAAAAATRLAQRQAAGGGGSSRPLSNLPPLIASVVTSPPSKQGGGMLPLLAEGVDEDDDSGSGSADDDNGSVASSRSGASRNSAVTSAAPPAPAAQQYDEVETEEEQEVEVEVEEEVQVPDTSASSVSLPSPPPPAQPQQPPLSAEDEALLEAADGAGVTTEWVERYSYSQLRCYYVHRPTRTTTWAAPQGDEYNENCTKHDRKWELRWDADKSAPYFVLRDDDAAAPASRKELWVPSSPSDAPPAGYQANGYPDDYDGAVPDDYWVTQDTELPSQADPSEMQKFTFYWNILTGARQWEQPAGWPRPTPDVPPPAIPPPRSKAPPQPAAPASPPAPPAMITVKRKVKRKEKRMVKVTKKVPRPVVAIPSSSSSSSASPAPSSTSAPPSAGAPPSPVSTAVPASPTNAGASAFAGSPTSASAAASSPAPAPNEANKKQRRGTAAMLAGALFGGGGSKNSRGSVVASPGPAIPAVTPAPTKPLGPPPLIDPEALLTFFEFFTGSANAPETTIGLPPGSEGAAGAGAADAAAGGAGGVESEDDDIDENMLVFADYKGYLRKKGGGTSWLFGRRNWKERFFVLQRGVLSYYDNQDEWERGKDPIKHIRIAVKYYRVDPRPDEPTLFSLVPDYTVEDNESTGEGLRSASSRAVVESTGSGSGASTPTAGAGGGKKLAPIMSGRVLKDGSESGSSDSDRDDDDDDDGNDASAAASGVARSKSAGPPRLQRSLSRAQIETEVSTEVGGLSASGAKSLLDRRVFHFEAPSQEVKTKWVKVLRGRRMDGKHRNDSPEFQQLYAAVAAARKAALGVRPPPGFGGGFSS